jgi:hypothetical protein
MEVTYRLVTNPDKPPSQVKRELADVPGTYFVAEYEGAFKVFAANESDDLQALQGQTDAAFAAGVRAEDVLHLVQSSRVASPKRGSPEYSAIVVAIPTDDPFDVLSRVDDEFEARFLADEPDHPNFWYAAAVVAGKYDILVDLGARTKRAVTDLVVRDLRRVRGIGRTITSYAYLPGNEIRPPKS